MLTLVLPYPPSVNRLYRTIVRGGRALPIKSREHRDYWQAVAARWMAEERQGFTTGPVVVNLTLYRPRRTGDIDGPIKTLLDSLNGMAWGDDSQIVEMHVFRRDDKANPRVEVQVWSLDESGQPVTP